MARIVLFEVTPKKEIFTEYLLEAQELLPTLEDYQGLIRAERFTAVSNEEKILSMSVWENEEYINKWRNDLTHRMKQSKGMNELFVSYRITVADSVREYTDKDRTFAPDDSNKFHFNSNT